MSDFDQDKHREIENELFKIHEKNQDTFSSLGKFVLTIASFYIIIIYNAFGKLVL